MTKRLNEILNNLKVCSVFSDVGCDHGFVSKAMLEQQKCKHAVISDISKPSLSKAIALLTEDFEGKFTAIVADGIPKVSLEINQVLIAGMGGEEIIKILKTCDKKIDNLTLQPMKNTSKVRKYLIENGYKITKDYTFKDDKFYNLIIAEKGVSLYSDNEIKFGKDNLQNPSSEFCEYIDYKIAKIQHIINRNKSEQRNFTELENKLNELLEIKNGIQ